MLTTFIDYFTNTLIDSNTYITLILHLDLVETPQPCYYPSTTATMVKVLENRAIDLDIVPGNKQVDDLAAQARQAATSGNPTSDAEGLADNAKAAAAAVGGTLGGGVKGTLDTVSNTVGTLAGGLGGTVAGVGDGLGSVAQYTGGTVGSGIMGAGNMMGLTGGKDDKDGAQMGAEAVETAKQTGSDWVSQVQESMNQTTDKAGEVGQNAVETSQQAAGDAADKSTEVGESVADKSQQVGDRDL